jgi:hypothetical protein
LEVLQRITREDNVGAIHTVYAKNAVSRSIYRLICSNRAFDISMTTPKWPVSLAMQQRCILAILEIYFGSHTLAAK